MAWTHLSSGTRVWTSAKPISRPVSGLREAGRGGLSEHYPTRPPSQQPLVRLRLHRHDRLGGLLHEYKHTA
jgi:hypothetical protein